VVLRLVNGGIILIQMLHNAETGQSFGSAQFSDSKIWIDEFKLLWYVPYLPGGTSRSYSNIRISILSCSSPAPLVTNVAGQDLPLYTDRWPQLSNPCMIRCVVQEDRDVFKR
jgi:hypothetical protein